ncbi:MAG: GDP-mannose 4,6-dehydratase [bacterium]
MKAMIFGITGQDGYYLNKLLSKKNVEVIGVSRSNSEYILGDISDFAFVNKLIETHKPKYIFHLSANSTTAHDALFENNLAISTGTLNILESVKNHCPNCKVFISGSAMQFKNSGIPIDENTEFEASSPYAIARIQSVYAGRYYRDKFKIPVYVGYFFNHDSNLRTERHVNKKITNALIRTKNGSEEKLELGNIDIKKEFNFAGDVVEAVWILVNQDKIFEAVIGSGKAYSLREFIEYCFNKIGKNYEDYIIINKSSISEYNILVSNPTLINSLGYAPKIDFYKLADMSCSI